jgi:hypothetical protein
MLGIHPQRCSRKIPIAANRLSRNATFKPIDRVYWFDACITQTMGLLRCHKLLVKKGLRRLAGPRSYGDFLQVSFGQPSANRDSERGKREITEFFEKVLQVANRSPTHNLINANLISLVFYLNIMSRSCTSCQHLKRPEIDRRLAAGEPVAQVARDYNLNASSLHRHKTNCLKLGSSNEIKKDAARGSAALALLPSKENIGNAYSDLCVRIDAIVKQAQEQGSLNVAISGLNSIRQTLDMLPVWRGTSNPPGRR